MQFLFTMSRSSNEDVGGFISVRTLPQPCRPLEDLAPVLRVTTASHSPEDWLQDV
jgi:hypothetical protein